MSKPISEVFLEDCMVGMARYPDKFFDLACVDPPYGIGVNHNMGRRKGDRASSYKAAKWDSAPPPPLYFQELFRISKDQIIWGANHFISQFCRDSACWLLWDKGFSEEMSFAQFEMAWTSFDGTCKKYDKNPNIYQRIHPTQKPVQLYVWSMMRFSGQKIKVIDTHMGSQSSRIACYDLGFDFWGYEIDPDHFKDGNKRFANHVLQPALFDDPDLYTTLEA